MNKASIKENKYTNINLCNYWYFRFNAYRKEYLCSYKL